MNKRGSISRIYFANKNYLGLSLSVLIAFSFQSIYFFRISICPILPTSILSLRGSNAAWDDSACRDMNGGHNHYLWQEST